MIYDYDLKKNIIAFVCINCQKNWEDLKYRKINSTY